MLAGCNEALLAIFGSLYLAAQMEVRVGLWAGNATMYAGILVYLLYGALSPWLLGGTIAQRLIGVRVQSQAGGRPSIRQGFVRLGWMLALWSLMLCCAPAGLVVGFLSRRPGRRWWHDHRAGTEIVAEPNRLTR
jgi:uncharacterized RDD family membrane protein YckC